MLSTAPSNGHAPESRELGPRELAILRLACDVPYFTAQHIDGWFISGDSIVKGGKSRRVKRSSRRTKVGGARAMLKWLVELGWLAEVSALAVCMEFQPAAIGWRPGEAAPEPFSIACHLRARRLRFGRRTWLLSSETSFAGRDGIFPALEAIPPDVKWDNVEKPKNVTIYSATASTLATYGASFMSQEMIAETRAHFK